MGLPDALTRLGGKLVGTLGNRLELASIELGEAREHLVVTVIASVVATLLLGGTVAALSAWVAVALWPTLGHAVLGWLALVYGLAGASMLLWLRARARRQPRFLADTVAELTKDAASLRGVPRER